MCRICAHEDWAWHSCLELLGSSTSLVLIACSEGAGHALVLTYLVPVLFTFCILGVLKLKKIIQVPKG